MAAEPSSPHPVTAIVVMGVSGAGKTTIGKALARRLDMDFIDADDLHTPANVARMAAGLPLTDADRAPWLARVGAAIDDARRDGRQLVIACSALRRCYRQAIGGSAADVRIVWLTGAPELIRRRMGARQGHFMTATMLDSQLATLEPPAPGENIPGVDVDAAPADIVDRILAALFPGMRTGAVAGPY